jgi:NAD-dependent deacetylase
VSTETSPPEQPPAQAGEVERVAQQLAQSRSLLFITGAGLSADSGLPTYRGVGGLYEGTATEDDLPIETALSGDMFRERPELTWRYIAQIESACRGAACNRGHRVIAEMQGRFERVVVLTQNVDGLHRAAGSQRVIDIHGDIYSLVCTHCDYRLQVTSYAALDIPPRCPACHSLVRPVVVLFGEMLPSRKVREMLEERRRGFDMVFSVGTSSLFPYIVEPALEAARRGLPTVEINPEETPFSRYAGMRLRMRAAEALDAVWHRLRAADNGPG